MNDVGYICLRGCGLSVHNLTVDQAMELATQHNETCDGSGRPIHGTVTRIESSVQVRMISDKIATIDFGRHGEAKILIPDHVDPGSLYNKKITVRVDWNAAD